MCLGVLDSKVLMQSLEIRWFSARCLKYAWIFAHRLFSEVLPCTRKVQTNLSWPLICVKFQFKNRARVSWEVSTFGIRFVIFKVACRHAPKKVLFIVNLTYSRSYFCELHLSNSIIIWTVEPCEWGLKFNWYCLKITKNYGNYCAVKYIFNT